jgi:hypothetical protein
VPLSAYESDRVAEPDYRPLHWAAVAAFALGVLSVVAFAHPWLWSVPLLGLLAAAVAARAIRKDPTYWGGSRLNQAGALVCLGLGLGAASAQITGWALLRHDAVSTAETFMSLLRQGQVQKAFWLTVPQQWRREFNATVHAETAREAFRRFLFSGGRFFIDPQFVPDVVLEEVEEYGTADGNDYAYVRYRFQHGDMQTHALVHVTTLHNPRLNQKEWYVAELRANYEPRSKKIETKHHH